MASAKNARRPWSVVRAVAALVVGAMLLTVSGCAASAKLFDDLNGALKGRQGVMMTFNEESQVIDRIEGVSFNFNRDTTFDTRDSDGVSKNDSSVVQVSLGDSHIHHVGSTMIFAESGIVNITESLPETVRFSNTDPGTPWLNNIRHGFQNLWEGKAKTIMIRSQNGTPLAVYAGDTVEIFSSDIPKTTVFRVDGKILLVYRADYTAYDSDLLDG